MTRVLIVDDKEENLYLLNTLLQSQGYIVEEARNGVEALEKAHKALPELIISDLLMPVMDGYTLLQHWKKDERLKQTPFIIYTATYTDAKDEQLALEMGADAFFLKPMEAEAFFNQVQEVLARHATRTYATLNVPKTDEQGLLKQYNESLIRRLEAKMEQLEEANRTLQKDIVERKKMEELLRKLSAAVEQNPVAVIITDVKGKIEYANARFMKMTGYTLNELIGQTPRLLKSNETPHEFYEELWRKINAGEEWRGEFHNRKKDGALYWDRSTISPIRNTEGVITHFLGVKENITAEKKLEAQYLQSQKMEAIGRLAGGIAHDFNNMLSVILGCTEAIMLDIPPESHIYKDLEQVQSAASRSADLTRQLLAFSRQQTIKPVVLDLNTQMKGMQELLRRLIGEDIDIHFALTPCLWPIQMDPSQVDQILANLAVNARDAMPDGGKLTIETQNIHLSEDYCQEREGFLPGDYVMLAVSDNGCGMSGETSEKIFEPFFSTKDEGKGTGLGLATIYGIIKQNNGFIHVYSEIDQGTTFRIYLPRYISKEMPVEVAPKDTTVAHGNETVLLVEDNTMLRTLAKRMLERMGYFVLEAARPDEALDICEKYPESIHLLLTDVVMPLMNGKELRERINSLRPEIKTLFMSGYTADAIATRGVLDEGMYFVGKPFCMNELGIKVRQVLET